MNPVLCFVQLFGVWHCFAKGQRLHEAGLGFTPDEAAADWPYTNPGGE